MWSVADAVTVAVGVARAGASRQTGLVVVEDAVAVHVVVQLVADAVAVHVVRQARRVERIAQAVHLHGVEVAVVVVVVVRRQSAGTVRVLVREGVAVRVHGQRRIERSAVRSGEARTVAGAVAVAEAVAVRVRVVGIRADERLVLVGQAVVVVVLVLDERVGRQAGRRVVVGEFIGHAVAVEVFQNFEPEGGFNREGRVRGVRPNRVRGVVHRFGRRAGDDAGGRIEHEASRQGRRDRPRGASHGVGRLNRRRLGVVDQDGWTEWARSNRVGVRTCNAHASHRVGAVAHTVTVGVGVEGIRAKVAGAVVDAGARLRQVGRAVTVVVQVFHQFAAGRIVLRQLVGQTVAVRVFEHFEVEGEEQTTGGGVAVDRVFGQRNHFGGRAADDAACRVDRETRRQGRVNLVRAIRDGVLRRQRDHDRVVDRIEVAFGGEAKRRVVRTGHADGRHRVGAVANAVVVGVRIKRIRTGVGRVHVQARVRLVHVVQAVTIVVFVFDQGWNARGCSVDAVGHAVAVGVRVGRRVKREGVRSSRAHAANRVGAVAHAVTVGVRVRRVRAVVHLIGVQGTVRVVVEVFDQSG